MISTSSGTTANARLDGSLPEPMAMAVSRSFGMGGTLTQLACPPRTPRLRQTGTEGYALRYENVSSIDTNQPPVPLSRPVSEPARAIASPAIRLPGREIWHRGPLAGHGGRCGPAGELRTGAGRWS